MGRSGAVIGRGMVRVTAERLRRTCKHAASIACVQLRLRYVLGETHRHVRRRHVSCRCHRVCDAWRHGEVKTRNVAVGV